MKIAITFDDGIESQYTFVKPLFDSYNFKATIYVCRRKNLWLEVVKKFNNPDLFERLLTIDEILHFHDSGYEIGNHTFNHTVFEGVSKRILNDAIVNLEKFLKIIGLPKADTFAYPAFRCDENAIGFCKKFGFKAARAGFADYVNKNWHINPEIRPINYYKPGINDHRIYITGVINGNYSLDYFKKDLDNVPEGCYPIYATHGFKNKRCCNLLEQMVQYASDNGHKLVTLKEVVQNEKNNGNDQA